MSSPFDPADFRAALHAAADRVADYLEGVEEHPVRPPVRPGEVLAALPEAPPEEGEPWDELLADYRRIIEPNVTHWNHPGFMAYFSSTGSEPGIIGELLAAGLSVNGMLWHTAPAAVELELRACDWLRQALGLPATFDGHINDTASMSTFLALAIARESGGRAANDAKARQALDVRRRGLAGRDDVPPLVVYCSDQTHSSIHKAAIALGLGLDHVRAIATDDAFRLDVAALERAVADDRAAGRRPIAVVATVGTTSTTSADPVAAIVDVCEREGLWLHVDAAWAGPLAICPEHRAPFLGWERADSIVVNPHKWMFVPIDCSVLYVQDPDALRAAFALVPEYLRTSDEPGKVDLMNYGIQLGRRFRALKLWMVLRAFGLEGLRKVLREHLRLGQWLAEQVDADPGFERTAPTPFSVVCFRAVPPDAGPDGDDAALDRLNERLLERVNRDPGVFLSHTVLRGRYSLRLAVSNLRTEEHHVRHAWNVIRTAARELEEEST